MRVALIILQHFLYLRRNQQEMTAVFSLVDLECLARYCSAAEQYVLLCVCTGLPKWHGMVMHILNSELLLNFWWQNRKQ